MLLSDRTKRNAMKRVRRLTSRIWGGTLISVTITQYLTQCLKLRVNR